VLAQNRAAIGFDFAEGDGFHPRALQAEAEAANAGEQVQDSHAMTSHPRFRIRRLRPAANSPSRHIAHFTVFGDSIPSRAEIPAALNPSRDRSATRRWSWGGHLMRMGLAFLGSGTWKSWQHSVQNE
jgi:hypothetical protein